MRLLLDTHFVVWWLADAPELGPKAKELIAAPENLVFISAASVWELRIKEAIGKVTLSADFAAALAAEAFESLSVTVQHAHALRGLPMHHRDPFDRLLIAQAQAEGLTLVTRDEIVRCYEVDHLVL